MPQTPASPVATRYSLTRKRGAACAPRVTSHVIAESDVKSLPVSLTYDQSGSIHGGPLPVTSARITRRWVLSIRELSVGHGSPAACRSESPSRWAASIADARSPAFTPPSRRSVTTSRGLAVRNDRTSDSAAASAVSPSLQSPRHNSSGAPPSVPASEAAASPASEAAASPASGAAAVPASGAFLSFPGEPLSPEFRRGFVDLEVEGPDALIELRPHREPLREASERRRDVGHGRVGRRVGHGVVRLVAQQRGPIARRGKKGDVGPLRTATGRVAERAAIPAAIDERAVGVAGLTWTRRRRGGVSACAQRRDSKERGGEPSSKHRRCGLYLVPIASVTSSRPLIRCSRRGEVFRWGCVRSLR